jgi:hypothetical protein
MVNDAHGVCPPRNGKKFAIELLGNRDRPAIGQSLASFRKKINAEKSVPFSVGFSG